MAFANDFKKVTKFYIENKDYINNLFKDSDIFSLELDSKDLAKIFDRHSGIDYILKDKHNLLYGIAARINFNKYMYRHITIRYSRSTGSKTEYQKGIEMYNKKSEVIKASVHLQIDSKDNKPINSIVLDRLGLFLFIQNDIEYFKKYFMKETNSDGNKYLKLSYDNIREFGVYHSIK